MMDGPTAQLGAPNMRKTDQRWEPQRNPPTPRLAATPKSGSAAPIFASTEGSELEEVTCCGKLGSTFGDDGRDIII